MHCRTSAAYRLRARRGRLVPAALLALALGLGCGLLAQVVFGLGDAMPLGHPVAMLTWYVVGLGAAVWLQEARCQETKAVSQ